jgi:formate hydrogenlyase transcriptional activator
VPTAAAGEKTAVDGRYRALLDASIAIAEQPTVKAVLHSLRGVLSRTCTLHGAHLWVLSGDGSKLQVMEFDREADAPPIPTGTTISCVGAVAQVLAEQRPIFIADLALEMSKHSALAPFAADSVGRSTYLFPVSTAHNHYGFLAVTKERGDDFLPEDVDLLRSLASHVAVALESGVATDRAQRYQVELAKERDRLRLLLEINNNVVSQLAIGDVFRAASAAIRSYFGNDFTGIWLINRHSNQLESVLLDFPSGKGLLADVTPKELTEDDFSRFRARQPEIWSLAEIEKLPPAIAENLRSESIRSIAITPLVTASGPLGLLAMGSRSPDAFRQDDLDLLSQIGAQSALALDNALAYGRLSASHADLEQQRLYLESEIRAEYGFEEIVGKSAALRRVLDQVSIVAPTDSTVLLHGETGTGKELIARAIHNRSPRRDRTFVRLNCAAIPSGLVESELFGHEKGAFTGAIMQKRGRFELADRGTLFLDEIGDISLELQPKLLRAIQEQEFERLGSTKTFHVDVRLIAATHRDLPTMIRNNQFREDLFYRLNVFPIEIPALRDRREDIPLLVHYFVSRLSRRVQKRITSISKQAMDALVDADWPGNIRELENFIERCVILTQGDTLQIPEAEIKKSASRNVVAGSATFEQAERQVIVDALKAASGKIAGKNGAAERLGLKRTTLQNKMNRLNVTRADYAR